MLALQQSIDAFYLEHRSCGDLDGRVERERVWMLCESCGATFVRRADMQEASPDHA